jgi:hypothetical protein
MKAEKKNGTTAQVKYITNNDVRLKDPKDGAEYYCTQQDIEDAINAYEFNILDYITYDKDY